ncbi:MAG: hypothetical protein GF320_20685 [Armatimonadia bacterium]|nr:hypothetical protein [Armatimonadia bacterium]
MLMPRLLWLVELGLLAAAVCSAALCGWLAGAPERAGPVHVEELVGVERRMGVWMGPEAELLESYHGLALMDMYLLAIVRSAEKPSLSWGHPLGVEEDPAVSVLDQGDGPRLTDPEALGLAAEDRRTAVEWSDFCYGTVDRWRMFVYRDPEGGDYVTYFQWTREP